MLIKKRPCDNICNICIYRGNVKWICLLWSNLGREQTSLLPPIGSTCHDPGVKWVTLTGNSWLLSGDNNSTKPATYDNTNCKAELEELLLSQSVIKLLCCSFQSRAIISYYYYHLYSDSGSTEQSTQTQEKKEVKYMIHINGAMTILFFWHYRSLGGRRKCLIIR